MYDTNEIYHHGVSGMKWGKRNGPPYPLNAEGKAELRDNKKKEQRAQIKAEKKNVTFKNYTDQDKHRLVRNTAIGTVIGGPILGVIVGLITDDQIRKGKGKAASNLGIDLKSQEFSSAVSKGEAILNNSSQNKFVKESEKISKDSLSQTWDGIPENVSFNDYWKKYLGTDPVKARNSFSSDERKDLWEDAMSRATDSKLTDKQREYAKEEANKIKAIDERNKNYKSPNNNRYDITFLEAIQNKEILQYGDSKAIDAEYVKYKKDPEKYFTEEANKLRDI